MSDKIPLADLEAQAAAAEAGEQLELESIHDFAHKLALPGARDALEHYVRWQVAQRSAEHADAADLDPGKVPDFAPVSINLDLTTACNYACDHCVDLDILNTGIRFDHDKLLSSLKLMAGRGLRSVIVIGGGEPTLYPKFEEVIRFMKEPGPADRHRVQRHRQRQDRPGRRLHGQARTGCACRWTPGPTRPSSPCTSRARASACWISAPGCPTSRRPTRTWWWAFPTSLPGAGAFINDTSIVENLHEIALAAKLARDSQFDYISFKPFLTRDEVNNAEVIDINAAAKPGRTSSSASRPRWTRPCNWKTTASACTRAPASRPCCRARPRPWPSSPASAICSSSARCSAPWACTTARSTATRTTVAWGTRTRWRTRLAYDATRGVTADLVRNFNATHECEKGHLPVQRRELVDRGPDRQPGGPGRRSGPATARNRTTSSNCRGVREIGTGPAGTGELLLAGSADHLHGHPGHTDLLLQWALLLVAGSAGHVDPHDGLAGVAGFGPALFRRAEYSHPRDIECAGEMTRPGIVTQQQVRPGDQRLEFPQGQAGLHQQMGGAVHGILEWPGPAAPPPGRG